MPCADVVRSMANISGLLEVSRRIGLILISLFSLSFTTFSVSAKDNDLFLESIKEFTGKLNRDIASSDSKVFISSTFLPASGKLLRKVSIAAEPSYCSGVLISPRHFLTAAHCLCEGRGTQHWKTYKTCTAAKSPTGSLSTIVVPAVGVFEASGNYHLSRQFDISADNVQTDKSILADLAVIELRTEAPFYQFIDFDKIVLPPDGAKMLSAGFGQYSITSAYTKSFGITHLPYSAGLGTVAALKKSACSSGFSSLDAICASFIARLDKMPGVGRAATCPGDSGGPLYGLDANNNAYLLGITSMRFSSDDQVCVSNDTIEAVFTSIVYHRKWLEQFAAKKPANQMKPDCLEVYYKVADMGVVSIRDEASALLVMVAAATQRAVGGNIDLTDTKSQHCQFVFGRQDTLSCKIPAGELVTLNVKNSGLVQVSFCKIP